MKRFSTIFNVLLLPIDFSMLLLAGISNYFLRTEIISFFRPVLFQLNLPFEKYFLLLLGTAILFVIAYALSGLYNLNSSGKFFDEFPKIVIGSSAGILTVIFYIFLRQELFDSRFLVIGGWFLGIVFVATGRAIARYVQHTVNNRYGIGVRRVLVIGDDSISEIIRKAIESKELSNYKLIKHFQNPELDLIRLSVGNPGVDEIILANPNYPADEVVELVDFCHENRIDFKFVPNLFQTLTVNTTVETLAGIPVVELRRSALDGWGRVVKRILDVTFSVLGLLILSPVILLISFAIKWESQGPVFVRLHRVSTNKEFNLLKFRSMIKNAEELKPLLAQYNERVGTPLFKMRNDPRVTKVGRFMRRFRLDELPQLVNVLMGDISLVGPRPHQSDEISRYQKHHKRVLAIKAGATGLAQVSGSSDLDFEEEIALDTYYIEHWSSWLDIKIILKTVLKMFFDKSAV